MLLVQHPCDRTISGPHPSHGITYNMRRHLHVKLVRDGRGADPRVTRRRAALESRIGSASCYCRSTDLVHDTLLDVFHDTGARTSQNTRSERPRAAHHSQTLPTPNLAIKCITTEGALLAVK